MADKKPETGVKISVIIPVYNTAVYLPECLDSVINQTFSDIEIICVDDGSTDTSLSILREYSQRDNRMIVLSQENKGAGAARNSGLDIAKGEYLSFLDSDDIFNTKMLETMYARAEEQQVDFVVCFSDYFDSVTNKKWPVEYAAQQMRDDVFSYKEALDKLRLFAFFCSWAWDKLFRKSFIDRWKLRFQEIAQNNDGFFVWMAVYSAERITIIRKLLVSHRFYRKSSITSNSDNTPLCFYEMMKAVKDGLIQRGIFHDVKKFYINRLCQLIIWKLKDVFTTSGAFLKLYTALQNDIIPEHDCDMSAEVLEKDRYTELQKIRSFTPMEYLFEQRNVFKKEYAQLQNSHSYRLGRMLTWFPRKVRGFFRSLKGHGLIYTMTRFRKKCMRKIGIR